MRLIAHRIATQAHYLLPRCAGQGPGVFALLAQQLSAARLPGTHWAMESLGTGIVKSLVGAHERAALVIGARPFPEYRIVVTTTDHGADSLGVSRYLVIVPTFWGDIRRALSPLASKSDRTCVGSELDPLRRAELGAFHALVDDLLQHVLRIVLAEWTRSDADTNDDFSDDTA